MPQSEPIKILLADDHENAWHRYRELLERQQNFAVIGEAGNADEAYRLFCDMAPTVVIIFLELAGVNGIEATRCLLDQNPRARVVILSLHEDEIFAAHALKSGAHAFVSKASEPETLAQAMRAAADGREYLIPEVARQLSLDENAVPI